MVRRRTVAYLRTNLPAELVRRTSYPTAVVAAVHQRNCPWVPAGHRTSRPAVAGARAAITWMTTEAAEEILPWAVEVVAYRGVRFGPGNVGN